MPAKQAMRQRLLHDREQLDGAALQSAARALCRTLLDTAEIGTARTVAAYVSIGAEPPTGPLLEALRARDTVVLLPILRTDLELDWAAHDGTLVAGRHGLREPAGPRRGTDAVAAAEVVIVPALAVDRCGRRLGRGGGCYDRALARLPAAAWSVALVYDAELLDTVPVEPHDQRVDAVATPSGLVRF